MIEINNFTSNLIDKKFIKKIVEKILKEEKIKKDISIAFVGPRRMRKLNKKYKGVNRLTDVLSFGEIKKQNKREEKFITFPEKLELAEVVICPYEIKKRYKKLKIDFKKEMARVVIHGVLHLLAYNHSTKEEELKMKKRENYFLSKI